MELKAFTSSFTQRSETSSMQNDLTFFTNDPGSTLLDRFQGTLWNLKFFDILVGYFRTSGFDKLHEAFASMDKIRIRVSLNVDCCPSRSSTHSRLGQHWITNLIDERISSSQGSSRPQTVRWTTTRPSQQLQALPCTGKTEQ